MPPFEHPNIIVSGFKEKAEAFVVQGRFSMFAVIGPYLTEFPGDRLYVGTSVGNLHIYSFDNSSSGCTSSLCKSLDHLKQLPDR